MIQIYKPNSKNTGLAISLQASDRDKHLYLNMIKQASWNAEQKKGSFIENRNKPGFATVIKFNQVEVGSLLDAIERFDSFSAYHSSQKRITQINFGPREGENPNSFSLRVFQTDAQDSTNKVSYSMLVSFGEARLIKEYLVHYLHKSFKQILPKQVERQDAQPETVPVVAAETEQTNVVNEDAPAQEQVDW